MLKKIYKIFRGVTFVQMGSKNEFFAGTAEARTN